jgi:hypothetical protein
MRSRERMERKNLHEFYKKKWSDREGHQLLGKSSISLKKAKMGQCWELVRFRVFVSSRPMKDENDIKILMRTETRMRDEKNVKYPTME